MGWQMKSIDSMGGRGDCLQRWRVEYGGPGIAHVDVCLVPSEAVGQDVQANWKARANTITFLTSKYFVTMNWDAGERPALTALTTKLEKSLKVD